MTRIYISGPMTGWPNMNFPAFNSAASKLRGLGFDVVNPVEISQSNTVNWAACMRADIKHLCDCDAIVMLDGWAQSQGAHLELHIAHRLEIEVLFMNRFFEFERVKP